MPATTIHFVRHGKVENPGHLLYERLLGFHLSDVGVRMAQATAHYIAVSPQRTPYPPSTRRRWNARAKQRGRSSNR